MIHINDEYSENKFNPCIYSNKLLSKLWLINKRSEKKIDLLAIKKAIYYAKKYHGLQKRQSGEPYYSHPLEVASMVADHCWNTNVLVTSILHDTLEDTKLTVDMIKYLFCHIIAEQVQDLTRIRSNQKISAAENLNLLYLENKKELLLIKYFDRLHNLQTIKFKSPEKILKIVEETLKNFIKLGNYFEDFFPDLYRINKIMLNLCYKALFFHQQLSLKNHLIYKQNKYCSA